MASENKDQQHPLHSRDRQTVDSLLAGEPTDYNLAELARLRIRYHGFPGATDIKTDLERVMQKWSLTEPILYQRTRQIHADKPIYKGRGNKGDGEDWN